MKKILALCLLPLVAIAQSQNFGPININSGDGQNNAVRIVSVVQNAPFLSIYNSNGIVFSIPTNGIIPITYGGTGNATGSATTLGGTNVSGLVSTNTVGNYQPSSVALTNLSSGNGGDLTNLATFFYTNFSISTLYTNNSSSTWLVTGVAYVTNANVIGQSTILLKTSSNLTNYFVISQFGVLTVNATNAPTVAKRTIEGVVPAGWAFTFTNTVTGTGNGVLFPAPDATNTVTVIR